ncbi:YceI family protein [Seonamhaeicola marinus]|uniref:YceI family protein n=1 Tax=Seonamhaeicola marinus TaxID=1912246 RepID=A0A5D0IZ22_9FLAO|nr:YceI family protein [Seonamhaeicola marinus]TYA86832.1 hypothetical protein FUA24_04715 [Seonamhaeicola marinus]
MIIRKLKILGLLLVIGVYGQAQIKYSLSEESKMKIDGSSTVSDWSVDVLEPSGTFIMDKAIKIEEGAALYTTLEFSFPVEKMESGRGPIMNSKIKKALKSAENPNVIYNSTENKITSVTDDSFVLESKGTIKLAGIEKPLEVTFNGTFNSSLSTISFKGSKGVTFSMFDIVKPTAFFGKLQTKDDLNVTFNVSFTK